MSARRLLPGNPEPLGVTLLGGGANIAVYSANATSIELCLFDASGVLEIERLVLPERTGAVFHGFVPGLEAGARYGLRAYGPYTPAEGHRFNPAKLLVDPYARALDRSFRLHAAQQGQRADGSPDRTDSASAMPKAIVTTGLTTWESEYERARTARSGTGRARAQRPGTSWSESVIYEMHVRGFTRRHPDVPSPLRGTCAGLAHPAALDHLVKLGITAVELLPVAASISERHLASAGLTNYWGYNTVGWMVPDARLAPGGIGELRACVEALHEAGIEVLLDVVLNHSGESDENGPTLSLRGLDNATYYRLVRGDPARYVNDTGTGNTLALDRAPVARLALDTLRHYAEWAGVDGFRYDLATTLGRREQGFHPAAPLLSAIEHDPVLSPLKHIAEPWDIGHGGYQLGNFPPDWGEWNDRYRDAVRRFWRGHGEPVGELATRLSGSPDVFGTRERPPTRSVNFVTAHDGFTLADLVSYERKQNEANGEGNRDGTNANSSWNHGHEGPSDDPRIRARRQRDARALLATLLCSRGTPMLSMGDELGHSQGGNNNAYAQDNETTWIDWGRADRALIRFTGALVALRKAHPALRDDRWLTGTLEHAEGSIADVQWFRTDGHWMSYEDWSSARVNTLVASLIADPDDRVLVVIHGGSDAVLVHLPPARTGYAWRLAVDTSADLAALERHGGLPTGPLPLGPRSVALLLELPHSPDVHAIGSNAHMTFPRAAGLLLHPTSLPNTFGIGDLGPEAHHFAEFMASAGFKIWQVLPIGPTGYGDSPYQCFSAFAGNPLLVHVPGGDGDFPKHKVDFGRVIAAKGVALRRATDAFVPNEAYRHFCTEQAWWLEDYALFMALKRAHGGVQWTEWEAGARLRDPDALARWQGKLAPDVEHHRRTQFLFFRQWGSLRAACTNRGIRIMGDLPIYVAHDSADVWAAPGLFKLDADGRPTVVAGVPPDYFSATGQLWGNPIYDWAAMRTDGFAWWIRRMRAMFAHFDIVRIDHFRGFEAYWEIPGGDTTAVNGRWVKAPGDELFTAITAALGPLPIVAENLGLITPEVEALRAKFGYPGMSILQFAFGADGSANDFQPHTYPRDRVVYTGTHDNDTTVGWWNSQPGADSTRTVEMIRQEKDFACRYLGSDGSEIHWTMMRAALASVADTALIPMQDLLGLGGEARMNLPGRQAGNWGFRFSWDQVTPDITRRIRALVDLYQR